MVTGLENSSFDGLGIGNTLPFKWLMKKKTKQKHKQNEKWKKKTNKNEKEKIEKKMPLISHNIANTCWYCFFLNLSVDCSIHALRSEGIFNFADLPEKMISNGVIVVLIIRLGLMSTLRLFTLHGLL